MALINGFLVGGTETSPETAKYEFGLQPGISNSFNKWKIGLNYYHGFTNVFEQAELSQYTDYWETTNSAVYFTVAYRLFSF